MPPIFTDNWPKLSGCRVGHLNINSLLGKHDQLKDLLLSHPLDVFGITESRLNNKIEDCELHIPGYNISRRDPTLELQTGICVYISESLNFTRRFDLEPSNVECIWVEFKYSGLKSFLAGFIYRNPKELILWEDHFSMMIDDVVTCNKSFVILGDFNYDLNIPQSRWNTLISRHDLNQLVHLSTRVTERSKTLIDHIYVDQDCNYKEVCVIPLGISDHFPTCITLNYHICKYKVKVHTEINFRNFNNFNIDVLMRDRDFEALQGVFSITDPDKALDFWLNIVRSIFDKHAPLCTKRIKRHVKIPWYSKAIEMEIKKRDQLLKSGSRELFKKQRNYVKLLIRRAKKEYFQNLIYNSNSPKSIWDAIHQITGRKSCRNTPSSTTLNTNDFSLSFASTNSITNQISTDDINEAASDTHSFCNNIFSNFNNNMSTFSIPWISMPFVHKYLSLLKPTKTFSADGLSNYLLKLSAPCIAESLTYIYNLCIAQSYFPKLFKQAKVVPIYKKGDRENPANFRPISVLSSLAKPLERHIFTHLNHHLEKYCLLNKNQSGFRNKHSCQSALLKVNETWLGNINSGYINGSLFVDFKQAFDVIDHSILLKKLACYGLDDSTIKTVQSFLSDRMQYVSFNNAISRTTVIRRGVPQGSILGPQLFSLYINDLPLKFNLGQCEMFADDTSVHVSDQSIQGVINKLQICANQVLSWANLNKMTIHPEKTKYMIITTRQKRQRLPPFNSKILIDGNPILRVSEIKYLGVIIDENLNWSSHIFELTNKLSKSVYQLARIKNFIDEKCRKAFYFSYIHARLEYGILLFGGTAACQLRPLISLQKRSMKLISSKKLCNSNSFFKSLNILSFTLLVNFHKAIMIHKSINNMVPTYIQALFSMSSSCQCRLKLPQPRIDIFKYQSISFSAPLFWNNLPTALRCSIPPVSLSTFKKKLKSYLLN